MKRDSILDLRFSGWLPLVLWAGAVAVLVYLFGVRGNMDQPDVYGRSALGWMVARWNWSGADMSYAWMIPFISLWALWRRRDVLRVASSDPDWRGLVVVAMALLAYLAGIRTQQTRIVLASLIMILWGVPFFAFGRALARQLVFPCAYLVFCIPFTFLDDLTLPLRLVSTSVSASLLNGLGISVTRIGTAMHVNTGSGFALDVAHPCSGLRYLMAMVALTTAYAYFTQAGRWRRILLGAASIPLAMIGNIVRIVLIAIVGVWFGTEVAVGFYHDYSGYVVFAVATLLMIWIGGLLQPHGGDARTVDRGMSAGGALAPRGPVMALRPAGMIATLLAGVAMVEPYVARVDVAGAATADVTLHLPGTVGEWRGEDVYYCQSDQCGRSFRADELDTQGRCPVCQGRLDRMALGERTLLPEDTLIARKLYEGPQGVTVVATIVLTGGDQRSIHRPQQCLPAQGLVIEDHSVMPVQMPGGGILKMTIMHARPGQNAGGMASGRMVLAYWFAGGGHITHDHLQRVFWVAWDNLINGHRARWAYVSLQTVDSSVSGGGAKRLADFAREFYPLIHRRPPAQ